MSAAAEEISRSVSTVSAGSAEMGASIREISLNATEAAQVAANAVAITSIAEQTNLLAPPDHHRLSRGRTGRHHSGEPTDLSALVHEFRY